MKIENLIWSQVIVKDETGKVLNTFSHVSARYNHGDLIHFRQYTSAQGVSTENQLNYSHPELLSMNAQGITLKAYTWGKTTKDQQVTIELEF